MASVEMSIYGLHRYTRGFCMVVPAGGLRVGQSYEGPGQHYATLTRARKARVTGEAIVSGGVVISVKR